MIESGYIMHFNGVKFVSNRFCVLVSAETKLVLDPKKRRKRWKVSMRMVSKPSMWVTPNTTYIHPDLLEQLKLSMAKSNLGGGA